LENQATRLWHERNLEALHGNGCPAVSIEGAAQGTMFHFKVNTKNLIQITFFFLLNYFSFRKN
jgi:hypothetical protein